MSNNVRIQRRYKETPEWRIIINFIQIVWKQNNHKPASAWPRPGPTNMKKKITIAYTLRARKEHTIFNSIIRFLCESCDVDAALEISNWLQAAHRARTIADCKQICLRGANELISHVLWWMNCIGCTDRQHSAKQSEEECSRSDKGSKEKKSEKNIIKQECEVSLSSFNDLQTKRTASKSLRSIIIIISVEAQYK